MCSRGTGDALFAALATLHCGPFTAVASLVKAGPLHPLARTAVAMPVVYGFVAASAGGLALGFAQHRRPHPLLALAAGLGLVAYTWRTALEAMLWFPLAFAGLSLLALAAGLEFWLGRARAR